jgi:hypothetical protein
MSSGHYSTLLYSFDTLPMVLLFRKRLKDPVGRGFYVPNMPELADCEFTLDFAKGNADILRLFFKSNPNHNPKRTLTTARALTHNTCYAHTIKKKSRV